MQIEKKYMDKREWKRVIQKEYIKSPLKEKNIQGVASLLFIKEVTSPSLKTYKNNITLKIADKNFYWLQIGIQNENYWITAMYDNNKKLVQYYIDITEKNIIGEGDNTFFYDLFLDIVVLNTGEIILLDEDELEKALKEKAITLKQYDFARKKAKDIIDLISKEENILENLCNKYFNTLINNLENNGE